MALLYLFAFFGSVALTGLAIKLSKAAGSTAIDSFDGPQKFHSLPTPRIGGLPLWLAFVGTSAVAAVTFSQDPKLKDAGQEALKIVACGMVVLAAGLGEDLTKRVNVAMRLTAAMVSGALAYYLVDAQLSRLDVWFLDVLLQWSGFSLLLTAFAVAGIANAINIIDGYNGLAAGYSLLALAAIAALSFWVGDYSIFVGASMLFGAIAGFFVWNFPKGMIFLGDAGAYFVGFMIAVWSVLLVERHTGVSPWFPLMIVAYPTWETLFSIYRKKLVRRMSPGQPDGLHFHMLVYKRVVRWKVGSKVPAERTARNSLTAPFLWLLSAPTMIAALLFWSDSAILVVLAFSFGALYNYAYRRMVRFATPRWLVIESSDNPVPGSRTRSVVDDDEVITARE